MDFIPVWGIGGNIPAYWCNGRNPINNMPAMHIVNNVMISAYDVMGKIDAGSLREKLRLENTELYLDSGGFTFLTKHLKNILATRMNSKTKEELKEIQRRILGYQEDTGADVAFTLDLPIGLLKDPEKRNFLIDITLENALLALNEKRKNSMKLYAAVHGWDYGSSYRMASELDKYEFDGIAIGSLVPRSLNLSEMAEICFAVRKATKKPVHVFGVSGYNIIYILAVLDIDSFDSFKFMQGAKFREYHLPGGGMVYLGPRYKYKRRTITGELPCTCPICSQAGSSDYFSNVKSEVSANLALHNLITMYNEIKIINTAKREGWLNQLIRQKAESRPILRGALRRIDQLNKKDRLILFPSLNTYISKE